MFEPNQLAKLVAETLPTDAKPGENVIVGTVDTDGVILSASFKFQSQSAQWEVVAQGEHKWTGDNIAAAKVILRW